ncbi:MAG: tannase/feruloyl esterase family alpha/beta hydrolase, partial [Acidobacteria bacterium]|nr:tannase/feruloyl esterase family alpha/beta hydrolase [Acidobacteriota bacterium]
MTRVLAAACATAAAIVLAAAGVTTAPGGAGPAVLAAAQSDACSRLLDLSLPNTEVTGAEVVAAGAFMPPTGGRAPSAAQLRPYAELPAFCRVSATLTPSDDSDIKVEVWLPSEGWNGKYQAVGNGAFTGSIRHNSMAAAVARGYASSSTDTGHVGNTASFGLGHPEKVIDFGYRSLHEMTVFAKQAIEAHYGDAPGYSYWVGCSAGGRQAMKAAQRFPEDFDGIIAGAPGLDWTGRAGGSLRVAKPLEADEAMQLPAEARQLVHDAVL